jgi:hypothetical protein
MSKFKNVKAKIDSRPSPKKISSQSPFKNEMKDDVNGEKKE